MQQTLRTNQAYHVAAPTPASDCPRVVPWMLWWIVGVHLVWGIGLIFEPDLLQSIVILIGVDWIVRVGATPAVLSGILIFVSLLAAVGLVLEPRLSEKPGRWPMFAIVAMLFPQYVVVLAAFISDCKTLFEGDYRGRDVENWLLICALAPVVWGALLHTAAILERYAQQWKR